jgi:large subunit ribosomal protein L1
MAIKSKRYRKEAEAVGNGSVSVSEAVEKIRSFTGVKFDQTIECVLWLGIDPKQADQLIRGSLSLPHGVGKQKRVVAFCEEGDVEAAKKAGAVEAGVEDLVKKITDGWSDFDVAVASTRVMGKVGKLGRILGPQGKMPSPKNGTVTDDVVTAVAEFAAGKIEYKNDTGGNVHAVVGRQSFDKQKLVDNVEAFLNHIKKIKPASAKGTYIKKACLSATMSPSVQIAVS